MRQRGFIALSVAVLTLLAISLTGIAVAADMKMVGVVTKIELADKDAKTATVALKDNKTGQSVVIVINDELTLDKLKDHRIVEGDEIRCKYEVVEGKNVSTYFRKTAGC